MTATDLPGCELDPVFDWMLERMESGSSRTEPGNSRLNSGISVSYCMCSPRLQHAPSTEPKHRAGADSTVAVHARLSDTATSNLEQGALLLTM
jgi:hypothetical protein